MTGCGLTGAVCRSGGVVRGSTVDKGMSSNWRNRPRPTVRKGVERVSRITGPPGKSAEGAETAAARLVVARKTGKRPWREGALLHRMSSTQGGKRVRSTKRQALRAAGPATKTCDVKAKAEPKWRFFRVCMATFLLKRKTLPRRLRASRSTGRRRFRHRWGDSSRPSKQMASKCFSAGFARSWCSSRYRPKTTAGKMRDTGGRRAKFASFRFRAIRDRVVPGFTETHPGDRIFEADFQSGSYGYRPKTSPHTRRWNASRSNLQGKTLRHGPGSACLLRYGAAPHHNGEGGASGPG